MTWPNSNTAGISLNLSGTPGLRPIGLSPGSWLTSLGLGSMSRYSAQILICIPHTGNVSIYISTNVVCVYKWWRHQMKTFSVLLPLCAGNSPVTCEFPSQRPVTRSFDVFFDLPLNKRLRKQSWVWWFETPSCSLWRHYNGIMIAGLDIIDHGVYVPFPR